MDFPIQTDCEMKTVTNLRPRADGVTLPACRAGGGSCSNGSVWPVARPHRCRRLRAQFAALMIFAKVPSLFMSASALEILSASSLLLQA